MESILKGKPLNTTLPNTDFFMNYGNRLQASLATAGGLKLPNLQLIFMSVARKRQVFICGNGGSAGNAIHLANDFLYGIAKRPGGLRVNLFLQSICYNMFGK